MQATRDPRTENKSQQELRELFDAAAAKSLAVIDPLDAEPEMASFLHAVKNLPEQRGFVVQLFKESFSESFYMRHEPSQFLMFCMHDLRWPEVRECYMLSGEVDFLLKCVAKDLSSFQAFITNILTAAKNVASVKSSLVIRPTKREPGIPIEGK